MRQAQETVNQMQTTLDKLKNPSPATRPQRAVAQAQTTLDKPPPPRRTTTQAQQAVNQASICRSC
jgi:hypothetical protein